MRRSLWASWGCSLALAVVLVGHATVASAGPAGTSSLTILSAERDVAVAATSFCPGCGPKGEDESFSQNASESTTDLGAFAHALSAVGSGADQDSFVGASGLSGTGAISVGFSASSDGLSTYRVSFAVSSPSTWTLSGSLTGIANMSLTLSADGSPVLSPTPGGAFLESIGLAPGVSYELFASVQDFGSGTPVDGSWEFVFVPEPGSAALLGMGLLLLSRRRTVRA